MRRSTRYAPRLCMKKLTIGFVKRFLPAPYTTGGRFSRMSA
jgi:hypothetical protein